MAGDNVIRVVEFERSPPSPVSPDVVDLLERLLEQAKAGEFNGLMVITITSPEPGACTCCGSAWAGAVPEVCHAAVGAVAALKRRLLDELFEWGRPPRYRDGA